MMLLKGLNLLGISNLWLTTMLKKIFSIFCLWIILFQEPPWILTIALTCPRMWKISFLLDNNCGKSTLFQMKYILLYIFWLLIETIKLELNLKIKIKFEIVF